MYHCQLNIMKNCHRGGYTRLEKETKCRKSRNRNSHWWINYCYYLLCQNKSFLSCHKWLTIVAENYYIALIAKLNRLASARRRQCSAADNSLITGSIKGHWIQSSSYLKRLIFWGVRDWFRPQFSVCTASPGETLSKDIARQTKCFNSKVRYTTNHGVFVIFD